MRFATAAALVVFLFTACNESPTEPNADLLVVCNPSGVTVTCRATNPADVTKEVTWFSSGATGMFAEPGFFVPSSGGEVEIWARLDDAESTTRSAFLVDPAGDARRLAAVSGDIYDDDTNQKIAGVTVRIVEGYGAGRSAISDRRGRYTLERVLTGETFTVEASRIEYEPARASFRVDPPRNPILDIRMKKRGR